MAHRITNLSKGGIRLDGVDDQRHEIFSARCSSLQRGESALHPLIVAPLPQGCQLCHLPPAYFGVDPQPLRFAAKALHPLNWYGATACRLALLAAPGMPCAQYCYRAVWRSVSSLPSGCESAASLNAGLAHENGRT